MSLSTETKTEKNRRGEKGGMIAKVYSTPASSTIMIAKSPATFPLHFFGDWSLEVGHFKLSQHLTKLPLFFAVATATVYADNLIIAPIYRKRGKGKRRTTLKEKGEKRMRIFFSWLYSAPLSLLSVAYLYLIYGSHHTLRLSSGSKHNTSNKHSMCIHCAIGHHGNVLSGNYYFLLLFDYLTIQLKHCWQTADIREREEGEESEKDSELSELFFPLLITPTTRLAVNW